MQMVGKVQSDITKLRAAISLRACTNEIEFLTGANKKTAIKTVFLFGAPAGTRIPDPLIKSQMLYQLSYRGINHACI